MSTEDFTNPLSLNGNNSQADKSPSCRLAASNAYNKMKQILFKPFNFEKWLILALCVWLVNMFEGYGQNFGYYNNVDTNNVSNLKNVNINEEITYFINHANTFIETKLGISLAALIVISLIIITIISIVVFILLWIKLRFNFVLIDNLKYNTQKIQEPWREYKETGNSSFWWNVGFQAIIFAISGAIFIIFFLAFVYYTVANPNNFNHALIVTALILIPIISIFTLVYLVIITFFYHFVIPIMYKMKIKAIPAWKEFNKLFKASAFSFIKYLFVLLLYYIISLVLVVLAIICTCCLLGCLFSIPVVGGYIASFALLPIYVFFRLFSIEFLAQFGEKYDLKILEPAISNKQELILETI